MIEIQTKIDGFTLPTVSNDLLNALMSSCYLANQAGSICYLLIDGKETARIRPNMAYRDDPCYQQWENTIMENMNAEFQRVMEDKQ